MYNAQSYGVGCSTATTDLDRQDSNGVQVVLDTESHNRAQYMQNLDRQEMAHESHTNGMMLSSIPLPNNFQVSAGLMRYHSAPGSFLAALIDNGANVISHENGISQILSNDSSVASVSQHNDANQKMESEQEHNNYSKIASHLRRSSGSGRDDFAKHNNQLAPIIEHGMEMPQNNYSSSEMTMLYHQTQGSQSGGENVVNNNKLKSENVIYSDLESCSVKFPLPPNKHSLCRQTSSPAGVLSRLAASAQGITEIGYLGGMPNGQISTSRESGNGNNSSKQNHQMNHLTRENSCPAGLLAHIPLNMDFQQYNGKFNMNTGHPSGESLVRCSSDSARLRNADQMWENGSILSGNYDAVQSDSYLSPKKRKREMDLQDKLEEDPRSHGGNNHHFGLFKSMSSDLSLEKILEESVPCRIRAKRGCATHPRSIAERVRRTKISDRIKKLQDLVPNMDKQQTNTADMLDEAVEYVKFLQKKVEELSDRQSKCTCGSNQKVDENS